MAKDTPVPEQFITKWNPKTEKFETTIYDTDVGWKINIKYVIKNNFYYLKNNFYYLKNNFLNI